MSTIIDNDIVSSYIEQMFNESSEMNKEKLIFIFVMNVMTIQISLMMEE